MSAARARARCTYRSPMAACRSSAARPTWSFEMRILIVDDSSMMRWRVGRLITLSGVPAAEILEAANGAEALAVLESTDVQLLLTDINMPVMTGLELLREIAPHERWRNLVRVIISTDGSSGRRDEA